MADITGKTRRGEVLHYVSVNDGGTQQANYNNDGAIGENAVAIGPQALAFKDKTVSIGHEAGALSAGDGAVAIGAKAQSIQIGAVAIGWGTSAIGESVAIGGGQAVTRGAKTSGAYGVAIGPGAQVGYASVGIGFGRHLGVDSVGIGYDAGIGLAGKGSVSVGHASHATENYSTSVGYFTSCSAEHAVALGSDAKGNRAAGVVGYDPATGVASTDATSAWKATRAAVSVGDERAVGGTLTRQIVNVAAGTEDTDAVNVAQLKAAAQTTSGGTSTYFHANTNDATQGAGNATTNLGLADEKGGAVGRYAVTAGLEATANHYGTAIGWQAKTVRGASVAIGTAAQTQAAQAVAIGAGNGGTGLAGAAVHAQKSIAIGSNSVAGGGGQYVGTNISESQILAVGFGATATGDQAVAVGADAFAEGASGVAVGNDDLITASKANDDGVSFATATNGGGLATVFQNFVGRPLVDVSNLYVPTYAKGHGSTAVGSQAQSLGAFATTVGTQALAANFGGTAVGMAAHAEQEHSVAVGSGSVATGYAERTMYDPAANANVSMYINDTLERLVDNTNTISVGKHVTDSATGLRDPNTSITRRITNVGAGMTDNDAVNVGQLKRLVQELVNRGVL